MNTELLLRIAELLIVTGLIGYLRRIAQKTAEIAHSVVNLPETIADHEQRIEAVEGRLRIKRPPAPPARHWPLHPNS